MIKKEVFKSLVAFGVWTSCIYASDLTPPPSIEEALNIFSHIQSDPVDVKTPTAQKIAKRKAGFIDKLSPVVDVRLANSPVKVRNMKIVRKTLQAIGENIIDRLLLVSQEFDSQDILFALWQMKEKGDEYADEIFELLKKNDDLMAYAMGYLSVKVQWSDKVVDMIDLLEIAKSRA